MKTRLVIIAILLLILTVLLSRNDDHISDTLLGIINPIKQSYKNFTQSIEDKSHSYIFQKESIEKLSYENRILRKRLLEQVHYIEEVKNIYEILPDLNRMPVHNISITETISYIKLNSFSQVILTKPKALKESQLYGLIQSDVVAGIARIQNNQLYGYLTSDRKCRFSVFIGEAKAPGIAIGVEKNTMMIKFIPKWHKVEVGDKVVTSGLDAIFFADIPVGIVTKVEVQSSYTVAHIQTYSDIFHPKTFFLINDARARLTEGFDNNKTKHVQQYSVPDIHTEENQTAVTEKEANITTPTISSIPSRIDQTQDDVVELTEEEPIVEEAPVQVKPVKRKKIQKVNRYKPQSGTLDLF